MLGRVWTALATTRLHGQTPHVVLVSRGVPPHWSVGELEVPESRACKSCAMHESVVATFDDNFSGIKYCLASSVTELADGNQGPKSGITCAGRACHKHCASGVSDIEVLSIDLVVSSWSSRSTYNNYDE